MEKLCCKCFRKLLKQLPKFKMILGYKIFYEQFDKNLVQKTQTNKQTI